MNYHNLWFLGTYCRIFRSFVAPRNKSLLLEPLGRAANRTAAQIDMTLRQVRADNAAYLRNNDKSIFAANEKRRDLNPVVLVLDNVRSAFNVGSMFRTAGEITASAADPYCLEGSQRHVNNIS